MESSRCENLSTTWGESTTSPDAFRITCLPLVSDAGVFNILPSHRAFYKETKALSMDETLLMSSQLDRGCVWGPPQCLS